MAFIAPTASRTNIAVALALFTIAPSVAVELQLRRSLPLRHAVHHRQVSIALFVTVHQGCARGPLPLR